MQENVIFNKLKEIIEDIKEEKVPLDEKTPLVEKEILDSLELINYLTQIEEEYGLNISIDELVEKKLGIVENMINYIKNNS